MVYNTLSAIAPSTFPHGSTSFIIRTSYDVP
jgi:hypothetical protein